MALSEKRSSDLKRTKYIRALDRFLRSVMGYLAKEKDNSFEGFQARVSVQKKFLEAVESVAIYKEEYIQTKLLVERIVHISDEECENFQELKESLLYLSNQLHKLKNQKKYKKEKHTQKKFSEWD